MAISKSTQDYDYEFLDLSDVNDYERDELKSTLYDSENKIEQKAAISEVPQANPTNPNRYEASSNNYHRNNNNRKDPRGGTNYSRTYQTNHYQNYYQHNRNYQSQDGNSQGNQNDDGSISLKNNNRQKPNTWSNKPRKYHHPGGGQQQQQQQTQLRNTSFQQYHQSGDYQTSPSIDKQRPQNLVPPQRPPSASSSNNYRGNNNNNSNNTNPRRQRQQEPLREGSGTTSRNPHHHHHHHQDQKSGYGGTGIRLGPARRTNSLNSCYSTTTETGSIENSGSWNDEDSHAHVLSENVETDSTVQVSTTPTSVAIVSSATDQVSQSSSPTASATGVIATTNMNSTNPAGVGQGSLPTVGQQPGMPATNVGQQAGHGGIPPHGAPVFAAPMQYPTAMYPTMQMLQPTGPSNVYVGNVTANVSVHGYMHMQPHYPMPTVTTAGAPGNYMPTASDMGVVQGTVAPIDNQGQQQNQRHGGGGNNRRGRGRTSSGSSGPRRDYTPRPNSQQDHLAAAQPGMLEQQQPHLMTAAPAAGYTQYFMPYSPYYQHQTIAPGVGHPAAQHATGHPLYLSPMPMYGGAAAAIGYGYPPGSVLYSVLPESYALPVEDKPEEVPQEVPQPMWSPQPSEHQQFQAPPPQQLQAQPQQVQQPDEIVSIETGIPEDYQEESGSQLDENTVNVNLQQPPPQIHHQTTPPQMMHHPHVLNPNVPNFIVPQPQEVMQGPIPAHFAQPPPALPADFQPVSLSPVSSYDHQNFVPPPPKTFTLDQPPPPLPSAEEVLPIVDVNGVPPPIIVANSVPPAFKQVPPVPIALDQCIALPPTNVTSSTHISEIITLPVNTVNPTIVAIPNQNVPKTVNKEDASVNKVIKATEKVMITKTDRFGGASNRPVAWNKKQTTSVSVSAIPAKETPKVSQPAYPNVSQKTVHPQPTAKPETKEKEVVKRESKEITANTKSPQPPPISLAPPPPPIEEQKSTPSQSWASLFSSSSAPKMPTNMAVAEPSKKPVAKVSPFDSNPNQSHTASIAGKTAEKKPIANEWSLKQADFLQKYKIDNNSISIFPRGLINRSNYCYINAILQALVSCPPFYHLMRDMPKPLPAYKARGSTPIIDAMQELMFEFTPRKIIKEKGSNIELITDTAFEPIVIYKMLSGIRSDIFQVEGRQEDAEEFLGCILNRLNDEMLELIKLIDTKIPTNNNNSMSNNNNKLALSAAQKKEENPTSMLNGTAVVDQNGDQTTDTDGDDWQVIGSRNKGTVTRTTDFGRTPISDIFRGKLRSRVHREGDHATDNIQPFFTLQLDIERATSVRDALELLVGRDPLEGVTSSKTNQEVTAWQQVTIEELPVVLVLHLKCFDYKMEGCTKILKTLEYSTDLKIDQKLLSSKTKYTMPRQRTYKLFAVVYHDGKEASKGHYLTDAFHIGYGSWIRYDDSMVSLIPESKVLAPVSPRVPYLLYYRRYDTINNNANNNNNSSNNMSNNNSSNNNNMSGNGTSNNGNASNNGNNSNTLNTNNTNNTYSNYHQRNNYHK